MRRRHGALAESRSILGAHLSVRIGRRRPSDPSVQAGGSLAGKDSREASPTTSSKGVRMTGSLMLISMPIAKP